MMEELGELSIGIIAGKNFRIPSVLRRHRIDYRSRVDISLKKACDLAGVSNFYLEREIMKIIIAKDDDNIDFVNLQLDILTDYVEAHYHRYFYDQIPLIIKNLTELVEKHTVQDLNLLSARNLFLVKSEKLTDLMMMEEKDLFNVIRSALCLVKNGKKYNPNLGDIKDVIDAMDKARGINLDNMGYIINEIYSHSKSIKRVKEPIIAMLKDFKQNLEYYVELQNTVLFPRAMVFYDSLSIR